MPVPPGTALSVLMPPASSTLPLGSNVAEWLNRPYVMLPVAEKLFAAGS